MPRLPKMSFTCLVTAGMGLGLLMFAGSAHPDALVVQPGQLSLSAAKPVADIQISNSSAEETTVHFNVIRWQQKGDRELLTPSGKVIVYPEHLTLKPGKSGIVRVGLRLSGPLWEEEAFRVQMTETPRIPDVGEETALSPGRRMIRQPDVPVFLLPPGSASPRLTWSFERNPEGAPILRARNGGLVHVRLNSAILVGPAGQSIQMRNMSDILLPGGSCAWELAPDVAAGLWHLTADTNAEPIQAQIELGPELSASRALTLRQ